MMRHVTFSPVRAILFDFDGVLVDSEPLRFRTGAQALEAIGVRLTWDLFARCRLGRPEEATLRDILGPRFDTEAPGVIARRNAPYEAFLNDVPFFPDAERLLQRFHVLVTVGDYARAKPASDPFLAAARGVGQPPEACLVIEDSPAGVAAAKAAGMAVVAADRRGGSEPLGRPTWAVRSLDALEISVAGEVIVYGIGRYADPLPPDAQPTEE